MKLSHTFRRPLYAALVVCATAFGSAQAQSGTDRIIVGFPPGGTTDTVARTIAEQIRADGGPAYIIENRTGAGGQIAVDTVNNAAPDGKTLLLTPSSMMMLYPYVYPDLRYDPVKDFIAVSKAVDFPLGIAVSTASGIDSFEELLKRMRSNPQAASLGMPGNGSVPHFMVLQLSEKANIDIAPVAYRGGPPAIADVIGGSLGAVINPIGDFLPLQKDGRLKIVAITGNERSPLIPDVPTLSELGYDGVGTNEWYGFFMPAKTNPDDVSRVNATIRKALESADVKSKLAELGFIVSPTKPEEFAKELQSSLEYWEPIVKKSGFTATN